ncbi:MAG: DUF4386 domain-containing protein [Chloroflexi bacterium]|nr:MAG: DUF4386 domain-containing protein [Chloroflexota bacterium]
MTTETAAALLLIAVPIAFNVTFTLLARSFSYPDILRQPAGTILTRFSAGGTPLVVQWWAFALTALLMVPVVALVASLFVEGPLRTLALLTGLLSALVQTLGLMRWPFVVPLLARRYLDPTAMQGQRDSTELIFDALHRYLGVGVGEHLGYLLTGSWTILTGALIIGSTVMPIWLGWLAIPIGVALLIGALEFVGPNESTGWSVAERVTPIAYIAWSLWLIVCGVALLL